MKLKLFLILFLITILTHPSNAFDNYNSPEIYRSYGKQQLKSKNKKGNTVLITPNYSSYSSRNKSTSEKIVAIYDKRSPAYGYRYVLYTPIGNYVGHSKIMQPSPNGYGYEPIPDGGEEYGSKTPCFKTIKDAKHYYYPEWY